MNILIVGGGGREHAIAWRLAQSPRVTKIYAAPGNAGIAEIAECVDINVKDIDALVRFAEQNSVDMTVVGPETPLIAGIVDTFQQRGLAVFGPSADPAQLEGSKSFAKDMMRRYHIPTADYASFTDTSAAIQYLQVLWGKGTRSIVIKADGEAAGKGVFMINSYDEALDAVVSLLDDRVLGDAGKQIVIEERLVGEEVSLLAITDGYTAEICPSVQDNKRALDGDRGLNTGGMGCVCPVPFFTAEMAQEGLEQVILPAIQASRDRGIPFKGVLYGGLMLPEDGVKALEYNVRFGDPETQCLMPLLATDLLDIIEAVVECRLDKVPIQWKDQSVVCVIVASGGYPGKYISGLPIEGIKDANAIPGVTVFHAGTAFDAEGRVVTAGGRVLAVTGVADTIAEARDLAYKGVKCIKFDYMHYRTDIGSKFIS